MHHPKALHKVHPATYLMARARPLDGSLDRRAAITRATPRHGLDINPSVAVCRSTDPDRRCLGRAGETRFGCCLVW
jgi:hypothetical protein